MRYLLLLLLPVLIFSGSQTIYAQENNAYNITKAEDIINDAQVISNIMQKATDNYMRVVEAEFTEEDVDKLTSSLKNVLGKLQELKDLKKALKDEEVYNAVALNSALELIFIYLYGNDVNDAVERYLTSLRMYTKELISLANAGVNIVEYVDNYNNNEKLLPIERLFAHTFEMGKYHEIAKKLHLSAEDNKIYNRIKNDSLALGSTYSIYANDSYNILYNRLLPIYNQKLLSKPLKQTGLNKLNKLVANKLTKARRTINTEEMYYTMLFTEKKYYLETIKITFKRDATKEDIQQINQGRRDTMNVCINPEYLGNDTKALCLDYIKNSDALVLKNNMSDRKVLGSKQYIMVDDEVCMIENVGVRKYYSNNMICEAIKKKIK